MTIGGVDISTYGLRLLEVEGLYNLPARKRILQIPGFTSEDIKFVDNKLKLRLYGKYANYTAMSTGVEALKTKLLDGEMVFNISEHGKSVTGICQGGVKTEIRRMSVVCTINVTVAR